MEVLTRGCLILSEAIGIFVIGVRAWGAYCKQLKLQSLMSLLLREGGMYFVYDAVSVYLVCPLTPSQPTHSARIFLDVLYLVTAIAPYLETFFLIRLFFDM